MALPAPSDDRSQQISSDMFADVRRCRSSASHWTFPVRAAGSVYRPFFLRGMGSTHLVNVLRCVLCVQCFLPLLGGVPKSWQGPLALEFSSGLALKAVCWSSPVPRCWAEESDEL